MPGVQLTVRQPATGLTRTAVTGQDGRFVFAGLPPASTSCAPSWPASAPLSRTDIVVTVGEMVSLRR